MSVDTSGGHPAMDYAQHKATYVGFIRGSVISAILIALTLIGMAIFLV
jgi:hypothetical protein